MDFVSYAKNSDIEPTGHFTKEELDSGSLVFDQNNGCWCLKRLVIGVMKGNLFIPDKGQSVKYSIAIHNTDDLTPFKKK